MKELHLLSKNERGLFFKTATDIKKMPLEMIEKDYWVVWVLENLSLIQVLKREIFNLSENIPQSKVLNASLHLQLIVVHPLFKRFNCLY